ncbi:hypothetical protein F444_13502 [Phytophthora nicotianae P1976]|uniref:RxLR effector protein n=1 Tax=Phytophthora nicotianae P1976 TaxID=1317066 RepID=A0A080ZTL8_PHYNI|nr:hypothetical protein F444_13502 [Phytophthora nicotianae P1976]
MNDGKTPGYVFKMFLIDAKVDDLLTNPQFIAWTKYANEFYEKNHAKKASMAPAIAALYGDDAVFGVLDAVKKVLSTEKIASKLQAEQIQRLLSSNQSPSHVFKVFNFDNTGYEVLSSPLFKTWFNYLKNFNNKNPDKKESLLNLLYRYYQGHGVARILEEAMKNPSTVKLAMQLQDEQYRRNLLSKNSPENTFYAFILAKPGAIDGLHFKTLRDGTIYLPRLSKASDGLLSSSDFKLWAKYLEDFNAILHTSIRHHDPNRASTVNDGAGGKKEMELEHEMRETQWRASDEKTKTAVENKIPVVIEDAATILDRRSFTRSLKLNFEVVW